MADKGTNIDSTTTCPICGELLLGDPPHAQYGIGGSHIGNGGKLGSNLIKDITKHDLYTGPGSIEAHHLICSESMRDNKDWAALCWVSGYNINCKENGVFLPNLMSMACQLKIPLHRGGHSAGGRGTTSYPTIIKQRIAKIKNEHIIKPCSKETMESLIRALNTKSIEIFGEVIVFALAITYDGWNYSHLSPIGCGGKSSIDDIKEAVKEATKKHPSFSRGDVGKLEKDRTYRQEKLALIAPCPNDREDHHEDYQNTPYILTIST